MSIFCSLPFTSIFLRTDGSVTPCCVYKQSKQHDIDGYFQSDELSHVKNSFLKGKFPDACIECKTNEKLNNASFRLINEQFESYEQEIRSSLESYMNIKHLSIVTSNVCNLKCLPCYSGSYIRMEELKKLKIIPFSKTIQLSEISKQTIDKISKFNSFEHITFTGGEPFVDKTTFTVIDALIDSGIAQNIRVDLTSNLTHITQQKLEKLKNNFKEVYIVGSIDGYGEINDYLRYPSRWQDIVDAIDLLEQTECNYAVTTAMSNLALMKFYQLVEWIEQRSKNNIIDMFQSVVTDVIQLQPRNLPEKIKLDLLDKYLYLKENVKSNKTHSVIDSCISVCKTKNNYDIKNTIAYLKKHDAERGTNYADLWPELKLYEQT